MKSLPKQTIVVPRDIAGKHPPHDKMTEETVISSMVNDDTIQIVRDIIHDPMAFHYDAHKLIFRAICDLDDQQKAVDAVSVTKWLREYGKIEAVGGVAKIVELFNCIPSRGSVVTHANHVRDMWIMRKAIAAAQEFAAQGYEHEVQNVQEWLGNLTNTLDGMVGSSAVNIEQTFANKLIAGAYERADNPAKDASVRLKTGILALDKKLGTMNSKTLVVIGAHPGLGKTSLARNIAINVAEQPRIVCPECKANVGRTNGVCTDHPKATAISESHGVVYFSRETPKEVMIETMALSTAKIDGSKASVDGALEMTPPQWQRLAEASARINKLPLAIVDDVVDMVTLRQRARMYKRYLANKGIKLALVVIDYAQVMLMTATDNMDPRERVMAIGKAAMRLAHELDCVVLLLSQLNNEARAKNRAPEVGDLAESKTLEQDAAQIILIDNMDMLERRRSNASTNEDEPENACLPDTIDCATCIVGKNRPGGFGGGGQVGNTYVGFWPAYSSFGNLPPGYVFRERAETESAGKGRR